MIIRKLLPVELNRIIAPFWAFIMLIELSSNISGILVNILVLFCNLIIFLVDESPCPLLFKRSEPVSMLSAGKVEASIA